MPRPLFKDEELALGTEKEMCSECAKTQRQDKLLKARALQGRTEWPV